MTTPRESPQVGADQRKTLEIESTALALVSRGRGILAADESLPTIGKRFAALNIPSTEESRRAYRELSFSFGRALQAPALKIWAGRHDNFPAGQNALLHRARCNSFAIQGAYSADMERAT